MDVAAVAQGSVARDSGCQAAGSHQEGASGCFVGQTDMKGALEDHEDAGSGERERLLQRR